MEIEETMKIEDWGLPFAVLDKLYMTALLRGNTIFLKCIHEDEKNDVVVAIKLDDKAIAEIRRDKCVTADNLVFETKFTNTKRVIKVPKITSGDFGSNHQNKERDDEDDTEQLG